MLGVGDLRALPPHTGTVNGPLIGANPSIFWLWELHIAGVDWDLRNEEGSPTHRRFVTAAQEWFSGNGQ